MTVPHFCKGNFAYPSYLNYGIQYPQSSPSFRGDSITQSKTNPQNGLQELPKDTVEISANHTIKSTKKSGISTATKWILGLVASGAAIYAGHRLTLPSRMQKGLKDAFFKDFQKDEAMAIRKKYKDIINIKDKDEFIEKVFAELKKDYGLENIPIKLDKTFKAGETAGALKAAAHFYGDHVKGLSVGIDKSFDNRYLFKNLVHELRHARQDMDMYRTCSKQEITNILKKRIKDFSNDVTEQDIQQTSKEFAEDLFNYYKKIGIKQLDSKAPSYEWGRKIAKSYEIYANKSKEAYNTTLYETDAKSIEKLMAKLIC